MCWGTIAVVDAGCICNMRIVCQIRVLPVPARLEVDLSSETIQAISLIDVVGIWTIISFVYAAETYPVSNRPDVVVRQRIGVIMSKLWITRDHPEARGEGLCIRDVPTSSYRLISLQAKIQDKCNY